MKNTLQTMPNKSPRIRLNIGGEVFETRNRTLRRFPDTLLGDCEKRMLFYCSTTQQYFFDRSRIFFDAILFFYQSGGMVGGTTLPLVHIHSFFIRTVL